MFRKLLNVRYYLAVALIVLGVFAWAGFTGSRLLGDDKESTDNANGHYGSGHSRGGHGGYARFYHK